MSITITEQNDISRSLQDFRNLEYSFMMDNGYLLFDPPELLNESDNIIHQINQSIKKNISSNFQEIQEFDQDILDKSFSYIHERSMNMVTNTYEIIIGIASDDTYLNLIPGYHHICNRIDDCSTTKERLANDPLFKYKMNIKANQIIFFHPYAFYNAYNVYNDAEIRKNVMKIKWYYSRNAQESAINHNLWESWDIFKKNGEFKVIDDIYSDKFFMNNIDTYDKFILLESNAYGEFINMCADHLIFRIRPIKSENSFFQLGLPSLYDSVVEIVYYFDISQRIIHTNYKDTDRFEVRTGGILARSSNTKLSETLYNICHNNDGIFKFDLDKIVNYFRHIDYNKLLCEWYPWTEEKKSEDDSDNKSDYVIDLKLKIKKIYSVNVYKFDRLDGKNLSRILMIKSWIDSLHLKGCFVLSDSQYIYPGYMIVSGEEVQITHKQKIGELAVFQDRFKSLHWKKIKHYHYSNHNYISKISHESLPDNSLILNREDLSDPKYSVILSIINNI
jgi:hypothetical protein